MPTDPFWSVQESASEYEPGITAGFSFVPQQEA